MRIAVTTEGQDLQAKVNKRFGRVRGFIVYDDLTKEWLYLSNESNVGASHGAGIQTAQLMVKNAVNAIITGNIGPKAFQVLEPAKIKMYTIGEEDITVADALAKLAANDLRTIAVAGAAHASMR